MLVYLIRRLGQSLLVVAVMATLVFVAMFAVGDPVDILASPDADQFERDAIAKRLGLDRPLTRSLRTPGPSPARFASRPLPAGGERRQDPTCCTSVASVYWSTRGR